MLYLALSVALIAFTLIHDATSRLHLPKALNIAAASISAPFRNFLTLQDVEGPVDTPAIPSPLKVRTMSCLAFLQAAGWLGSLTYSAVLHDASHVVFSVVTAASWVCRHPCVLTRGCYPM